MMKDHNKYYLIKKQVDEGIVTTYCYNNETIPTDTFVEVDNIPEDILEGFKKHKTYRYENGKFSEIKLDIATTRESTTVNTMSEEMLVNLIKSLESQNIILPEDVINYANRKVGE